MTIPEYGALVETLLYGPDSGYTDDEQAAMRRGYTMAERRNLSGCVYGGCYPQAVSPSHAAKILETDRTIRNIVRQDKITWQEGGEA